MADADLGRRRFIVAAVTFSTAAVTLGPTLLAASRAWALGESETIPREVLAAIARQMYPHDVLDNAVYTEVMDQAMTMVANDALFAELVHGAEQALGANAGQSFADAPAAVQLSALQSLDDQALFTAIRGAVGNRLYNHPAAWALMNYEGSSWEKGGYLDRGAGEVDWLPEDSS